MSQHADFHFLYLAPNLSAAWLFRAARLYWQRYQPIVLHDLLIVDYVPADYHVVVTTIARSDTADMIHNLMEQNYSRAVHDPLVYDYLEDAQLTLEARVATNQPFGVPLE